MREKYRGNVREGGKVKGLEIWRKRKWDLNFGDVRKERHGRCEQIKMWARTSGQNPI